MSLQRNRRRLAGLVVSDQEFLNQDLRNGIAVGASFTNCTFKSCKMGRVTFEGASFLGCHFEDCDFGQAALVCRITDCSFYECDFDQAVFGAAIIERTLFQRCRLEYASFSRATMLGGGFVDCQLHGTYLDLAESNGVDFSGSNLWGAVVPMSCAILPENKFDHRQLHMLLALMSMADIEPDDKEKLLSIVDPKVLKLVDRLVGSDEEADDDFGA